MKKYFYVLVLLLSLNSMHGQNSAQFVSHTVGLGETMLMISRKYLVEPEEIYRLNKHALNGVTQGMVLDIPISYESEKRVSIREERIKNENRKEEYLKELRKKESDIAIAAAATEADEYNRRENISKLKFTKEANVEFKNHDVTDGETLFGLAKKYNTTVAEIEKFNPTVKEKGLKKGQIIRIPVQDVLKDIQNTEIDTITKPVSNETAIISAINSDFNIAEKETVISHYVVSKETLYSISKKYNVSVDEITAQNKDLLKDGLKSGQTLVVKK